MSKANEGSDDDSDEEEEDEETKNKDSHQYGTTSGSKFMDK